MLVNETRRVSAGRQAMAVEVAAARRLFTREDFQRMADAGIFEPTERLELIRGEIIEMSGPGRRHRAFVDNLTQLLIWRLTGRAIVSVQNPLALDDYSQPQPDLKVIRRRSVPYKVREAFGEDTLLVIEVADTSLRYDRFTKLQLYAEFGIPEYWVIDCNAESIEIHRSPEGDRYREVTLVSGDATVTPQAFPDVALTLTEIFA
jgi:Uma2 family endonuclease